MDMQQTVTDMLVTHRRFQSQQNPLIVACIEASLVCAATCTACADACLAEDEIETLRECIRLDLSCADLCVASSRMLSRFHESGPAFMAIQLEALSQICRTCAGECDKHAHIHEHCRMCAEACRACERACKAVLNIS
jgi:hypothetical protein